MDDFDRVADEGVGCFAISLILRLVLGPDIAAFGLESTVAVDADERARASDFGGIVDDGPVFEIVEFGLDQIGRATCRERVWQEVYIWVGGVSFTKKQKIIVYNT